LREAASGEPQQGNPTVHFVLMITQRAFLVWLLFEVVVQLVGSRIGFFCGPDRYWNLLDVVVLLLSTITSLSIGASAAYLRVLRLARAARAMQALRFVRYSESLQGMLSRMLAVSVTLCWMACLMFILIYIVGIVIMEGLTEALEDTARASLPDGWGVGEGGALATGVAYQESMGFVQAVQGYYGGVGRTWVTLFRAVSGADWGVFAAPLSAMGGIWTALWVAYVFCMAFGLLNLVAGVIVEIVRRPLPQDQAMALASIAGDEQKLASFFAEALREDGRHGEEALIDKELLGHLIEDPAVSRKLATFGVDVRRTHDLYDLMDPGAEYRVTAASAARHVINLRGEAKAVDVMRIARDVGVLRKTVADIAQALSDVRREFRAATTGDDFLARI